MFVCRHGRTATDTCINDFEDQEGFTFVDAESDGNCFFHTLAMYYGFKHINQVGHNEDLHTELRQQVVQYMIAHYEDYAPIGVNLQELEEMREDGMWNSDVGDFIPPAAAAALNLHIQLYDIVSGTRKPYTKKRILLHEYPETGNIPDNTVSVLRINKGHYGLLLPLLQKMVVNPDTDGLADSFLLLSVASSPKKWTKRVTKRQSKIQK